MCIISEVEKNRALWQIQADGSSTRIDLHDVATAILFTWVQVPATATLKPTSEFGLAEDTLHCIPSLRRQRESETVLFVIVQLPFNPPSFEKAADPAQDR